VSAASHDEPLEPAQGVWETIVRGLRMSPELRDGLRLTLILAAVATLGRAVVPLAIRYGTDHGLGAAGTGIDVETTVLVVLGAGVAVVVTMVASGLMNARMATAVETALSNLRTRAFRHVHRLSSLHQAAQQRGALTSRVSTDIDTMSRFMQFGGLGLFVAAGQLLIAIGVMLVLSWRLTIVVLVSFVPFVMLGRWIQQRLTTAYLIVRERIAQLLGVLAETVVGAPVVRAYGIEARTQDRLDTAVESHRRAAMRAGRLSAYFSSSAEVFAAIATAGVVVIGAWLGLGGTVTPGTVVAFIFLIALFVEPVLMAAEVINEGQNAVACWRRVQEVLDLEPDVVDPRPGFELEPGPVGVEFDHVGFRYPLRDAQGHVAGHGDWALRGVDVTIEPRSKVAVVGETGSGKTTFAKLLTRLMDVSEGEVRLSGIKIDELKFSSLRRRVVMVPQEGMLFSGTIADNVRHGWPDADDGQLAEAMADLGLGDWLAELPDGIHTQVGERGSSLSAGERQLVALARAYVADPDLLVLDEATSAVDPATEQRLQRALAGLIEGRTTVTIAHRLSTAEASDEVLVFDQGRLVQRGHHLELVSQEGVYAELHRSWVAGTSGAGSGTGRG
jgi:ATP-binding cassette, subfamily B, bacterial